MRLAGRERLGFYPLPAREGERIRRFLVFPDKPCCALDPCVGDGAAFAEIASDKKVLRYGVELDAGRAEQARTKGIEVIHGNCFDVQCPVESFSLIYLNPPYDFDIGEQKSQRMEKLFLEHVHRWLTPTKNASMSRMTPPNCKTTSKCWCRTVTKTMPVGSE